MSESFTTNCYFEKPEVGASESTWGGFLNANLDTLDAMLAGALYGLTLSAAGSTATFGVAAGAANGMNLASAFTKTTSAWAVGTGNGSLDTGAIATSTWYHVWLIMRVDTMVVDLLVSTSATAPTMPTNYTRKRRIGAMKTDGASQWKAFLQLGDEFLWLAPVTDNSSTPGSTAATLYTLSVPTGVKVNALIRGYSVTGAAGAGSVLIQSPDETSALSNATTGNLTAAAAASGDYASFQVNTRTNTSGQIRIAVGQTDQSLNVATYGWIDNRGRS